jgi:hypothetical protein
LLNAICRLKPAAQSIWSPFKDYSRLDKMATGSVEYKQPAISRACSKTLSKAKFLQQARRPAGRSIIAKAIIAGVENSSRDTFFPDLARYLCAIGAAMARGQ